MMSLVSVFYAEILSIMSMAMTVLVGTKLGHFVLAHILVVVLFIGCGLGFIGWVKQRLNSALGNVASTLASIAIISVITKEEAVHGGEFSAEKIVQVLKMLVMGISITVAVNLLAWRVSARKSLRQSLSASSVNLGDMLAVITRSFINGSEDELNSEGFQAVSSGYTAIYTALTKNMREAKFEYYAVGFEKQYKLEKAVAKSMESIAQAIGGLRSACNAQFTLLKEKPGDINSGHLSPGNSVFSPTLTRAMSSYLKQARERFATLDAIDESEEREDMSSRTLPLDQVVADSATPPPMFGEPSEIFELFIALLGPSMKSLAYTLAEILHAPPFGEAPEYKIFVNENFKPSLAEALALYDNARGNALQEVYKNIEMGRSRSEKIQADIEEVAAACGHFSFSLLTVAGEIEAYLDNVDLLRGAVQANTRTWRWLKFWVAGKADGRVPVPILDPEEQQGLLRNKVNQIVRPIRKSALPKGIPDEMTKQRDTYSWEAAPNASKRLRQASQRMLFALRILARDDIRFGLKVAIGAMLWAMFAFIPGTRPTYQHWRGEWGLLSFMIVVAMTVGASNTTSIARFLGTIIGATLAVLGWIVSGGDALVLLVFGWLVSLYNFYLILVAKNGPLGRITLLAYNVTVLYAYSLSQKVDDDDDDDLDDNARPLIFEICYHRVVAVTLGILWGMIVCRLIWPISGRAKFREGLSVLYLQLGLIWKRGPLAVMLRGGRDDNPRSYLKDGEQEALQRYAFKLESLRVAAQSEFSLRGPFPTAAYGRILASTKRILDGFYAMSLIEHKRGRLSAIEKALLEYTAFERAQLCDRICHVFQVMASSIMLEYPMTDAIPSIRGNKDRLLGKIYQFRKDNTEDGAKSQQFLAEEKDYALLYAYILVTAQVAEELGKVGKEIEGLFGVLNEDSLLLQ